MKEKSKWAILIALIIIVSFAMVSSNVVACFGHTTECEGESVYQGDGGATDYWYADLYPPDHYVDAGMSTDWKIHVYGGGGCSNYEHCTVTDNTPTSGWTTTILMGTINSGSFHYIEPGNPPVNEGDNIEGREFYIGNSWNFNIIYRVTAPMAGAGGETSSTICTVYVVGYLPENQHDFVYVHTKAIINASMAPEVNWVMPNGGETLSGTWKIVWDAFSPLGFPMSFDILLSSDGGVTYPTPLATGLPDVRDWDWDTTLHLDDINYRIKVIAFDGTNYGENNSMGNFAINNYGPGPPTNLIIQFGLTTNGEPTSKAPDDDTGYDLERIQKDDGRGYAVIKGKTLSMDTFNIATQNDPVESATLYVKYWVNDTGYSGDQSVMWKLDSDIIFSSTGITPLDTDLSKVVKSFDLFTNGVDTTDKIAKLDIQFLNNDGGASQSVVFDYIWVTFTASSNDLGLTWLPSLAPDIDHYHIYRSPDDVTYTKIDETASISWNDYGGKGVDLNNYYYKVSAVDYGDLESLFTYTVAKYVTPLSNAWNMVSTPLIQLGDYSPSTVLKSIESNYDAVQAYHAGNSRPWLHSHISKPSGLNRLTDMNHMDGYYINVQTSDHLKTLGRLPGSEVISLKAGWNLIGYPSFTSNTRDVALSSISGKYNAVYRYDTATDREVLVQSSDVMGPGNGYWIHVTQDCDLTL